MHADNFKRQAQTFLDGRPYGLVPDHQPELGKYRHNIRVRRAFPGSTLGLILGDAIHTYRTVLDHIAWQLAIGYSGDTIPHGDTRTQFPIFRTADGFRSRRGSGQMHWMGPRARAIIEKVQPYSRPNPYVEALWLLSQLDNVDKHRVIPLVVTCPTQFNHLGEQLKIAPNSSVQIAFNFGPVVAGMELLRITFEVPQPKFDPRFSASYQVTLGDPPRPEGAEIEYPGINVSQALDAIREQVRFIFSLISPAFEGGTYDDGKL